ncbi:hypothetical protein L3X38_024303 [Prunus dulcis]|uniref:Uncharacterized protein n=1 Tax=Prunus dulcis TaxID=3755 RepID=A0AAD4VZI1_PRUDU|nr:hypothetical protein L3X38_024303 [Prunus dulcis]
MQRSSVRFQGETIIETIANEPSGPGGIAWNDVPSAGEVLPEERPEDKGKAPLEERDEENGDEEEDEIPLQRKRRASAPPTLDVDPEVRSKKVRVESSPGAEEAPLVSLEDVP